MALELCDDVRIALELAGQTAGRPGLEGHGRPHPAVPARRRHPREPPRAPAGDRPALRRRRRAPPPPGDPARHRRRPGARRRSGVAGPGVPHQRGPRRVPRAWSGSGRYMDDRRAVVRRGARGGACRGGVHHPHPGARRHRPVPPGADGEVLLGSWAAACGIIDRRPDGARATGPSEPGRRAVQHGGHGHAAGRAPQRRVRAARRGQPRDVRRPLARGARATETPVGSITNGVHGATWVSAEMDERAATSRRATTGSGPTPTRGRRSTDVDRRRALARRTAPAKVRLVDHVRDRLRGHGLAQGRSPSELDWVDDALDPDALTICFARRMATYKRAALLLSQPDRLRALLARHRTARSSSCSPARPTPPTTRARS